MSQTAIAILAGIVTTVLGGFAASFLRWLIKAPFHRQEVLERTVSEFRTQTETRINELRGQVALLKERTDAQDHSLQKGALTFQNEREQHARLEKRMEKLEARRP